MHGHTFESHYILNVCSKSCAENQLVDLCFHLLQAKGNRLDRKIGNVLKNQDIAFSFRPKDKDLDVQKLPFQVRYENALDSGHFVLRKKQIRGVTRRSRAPQYEDVHSLKSSQPESI